MTMYFTNDDLKRWAEFSNDYNPIHFDVNAAGAIGSDDLIVHGMLATLPIKDSLGLLAAKANRQGSWYQFKSRFKLPVPIQKSLDLTVQEKHEAFRFAMRPMLGHKPHIQGQLSLIKAPEAAIDHADQLTFERAEADLKQGLEAFTVSYPQIHQIWVALDAVVFSFFLDKMLNPLLERAKIVAGISLVLGNQCPSLVLQSSHVVSFPDYLMSRDYPLQGALSCRVHLHDLTQLALGLAGLATITCEQAGRLLMIIEIGLMMRQNALKVKNRPLVS